ncbi:MAG TPA: bile acid:sodium symporter family protein [Ohtaekwangia sp.]|nr:bile acid:sodium symporter family protein [Ohtaekwangia sp.]
MKIFERLNKVGLNTFFLLILGMVGLAWLAPSYGTNQSHLPLQPISYYGVSLIFFFYGLRLSAIALWKGLSHWKIHLVIQGTTFVLFPLIALLCYEFFHSQTYALLWIGFFYLAALPSTVSSSVVMISIAGGNLPAGIFNASVSSVLGILMTPLWMSMFIVNTNNTQNFLHVILSLCLQVLLPFILGLSLHRYLGRVAEKHKTILRYFDQAVILLIVYRAFCESFYNKMFSGFTTLEIFTLGGLILAFFLLMAALMYILSLVMKFSREDRITILFCGSKKSLIQGVVMAQVLFSNQVSLGIILLPLMLYHTLQLIAGSIIAERLSK